MTVPSKVLRMCSFHPAVAAAGALAIVLAGSCAGSSTSDTQQPDVRNARGAPVAAYPVVEGGTWTRGPNLKDAEGLPQPRQEHAAAVLNGFVYLIGGFVPIKPAPPSTENEPEPFPFHGTGEVLAYVPASGSTPGHWVSLGESGPAAFPLPDMHHIMAVAHQGRIWTFGGHAGPFAPTSEVFVFTPDAPSAPGGSWSRIRASDGGPCGAGDECFTLPGARSAGAAVSIRDRIYVIGGVVPNEDPADPVNESIRTTDSVLFVDTRVFPLRWQTAPSLHDSREHFNAVVVRDRIWVFAGRGEVSTHMRGVESMRPGEGGWRKEQDAPVGSSANVLAAIGDKVYSFGGEFIASNITGTLFASQVFDTATRSWSRLATTFATQPLDASGADGKHGTYGVTFVENGTSKIMAPGGAGTAWFDPMSKVHVFTP